VPLHAPQGTITAVLSISVRRLETADRVRDILFCASEAAECELLSDWLANFTQSVRTSVLERLRQDVVQKLTIARLRLEQAATRMSIGHSPNDPLDSALELASKFKRQAQTWRAMATDQVIIAELESIEFTALASDFFDLLQSEARVALVRLSWGRAERLAVLDSPRALSKKVLGIFLTAIQESGAGSNIEVNVSKEGRVGQLQLRIEHPASGKPRAYTVSALLTS
jgi:HAMP domain-containing protein